MKVRAEQLHNQLQRQQQALPVYLVSGDEPLLCGESCDAIRAHLRRLGFSEREVMHVDASFSWESLLESANALSLFAERKLIELRLGGQKLNRSASELLQRYLANPAPGQRPADHLQPAGPQQQTERLVQEGGTVRSGGGSLAR